MDEGDGGHEDWVQQVPQGCLRRNEAGVWLASPISNPILTSFQEKIAALVRLSQASCDTAHISPQKLQSTAAANND